MQEEKVFVNPRVVYVLLANDETVKIGITKDFDTRVRTIRTTSGKEVIKTYHTDFCSNAEKLESLAKNHFMDYRILGEWFSCNYCDAVKYIKRLYKKFSFCEYKTKEEYERKSNQLINMAKKLFELKGENKSFFNSVKTILFYLWGYIRKLEENDLFEIQEEREISFHKIINGLLGFPEYFTEDEYNYLINFENEAKNLYENYQKQDN